MRTGSDAGRNAGSDPGRGASDPAREAKRRQARRHGLAYQGAFESVFAIGIGAGFGYFSDSYFATSPWGVLVGLVLGFSAFVLRLVRLARQLTALADADAAKE
jgi:ATP synthase protein I